MAGTNTPGPCKSPSTCATGLDTDGPTESASTRDALTATLSACAMLARIAWPNEADDHQAGWAHRIAIDPDIGRNTYLCARETAAGNQDLLNHVEAAAETLRRYGVYIPTYLVKVGQ